MKRKLTTSHVLAGLALFIALGGTGYAAAKLPKNSVTTKQVKDRSLLGRDFKNGQIPKGPTGPQGTQGPAGISNIIAVDGPANGQCGGGGGCQVGSSVATCPPGSFVVGGGFNASGIDNEVGYAKRNNATQYGVISINYASTGETIQAQAICASGPGLSAAKVVAAKSGFSQALARAKAAVK